MKLITWNVNRAGKARQGVWDFVEREDADLVLLQEVTGLPDAVLKPELTAAGARRRNRYDFHTVPPKDADGYGRPYSSVLLSKGEIDSTSYLESKSTWVNEIFRDCPGWIIESRTALPSGERFRVVVVHSPHRPIPRERWDGLDGVDVTGIKATNNPDIFFTEILWGLLRDSVSPGDDTNWIVAGDFNTSVKFDVPKDLGNQEFIHRMNSIGLVDCLSGARGQPVPTFQQNVRGKPGRTELLHQLDYCFVSRPLRMRLKQARVPPHDEILATRPRLSDHLPILCDFR